MSLSSIAKEMLDIANGTDLDLVVEEEIRKMPPCDSPVGHPNGTWGHVTEQSASYLVGYPCGKTSTKCAGWVENLSAYGNVSCDGPGGCKGKHPIPNISIIPLNLRD